MRGSLFPISLLLSSAACSSQADYARETGIKQDPAAIATTAAQASAFSDNEARDGGNREFSYKWPATVSAEPALARLLREERERTLAREKVEWTDTLTEAPLDCAACRARSFAKEWAVVAEIPGYLSLSGDFETYTGGAHGMYGRESLVWDRAKRRAVPGMALFRSPEALDAALGPRLCSALNAEREKRRGEPVQPDAPDEFGTGFDACQHIKDATVLVGSSSGKAFDRIGVWFGPYVAGPYAEGPYELDFPVDAAVLKAVKPEYSSAFAVER